MSTYVGKTWKNRVSEYPYRRILTDTDGNETQVIITRDEGTISTSGDAFTAENMNNLETRIATAVNSKMEPGDLITDYDDAAAATVAGEAPDCLVIAEIDNKLGEKLDEDNVITSYATAIATTETGTVPDCVVIAEMAANFQAGCDLIADALSEAGIDTADDATPEDIADAISSLTAGDGAQKDLSGDGVYFYNNVGTAVYNYTWDEITELTEMPDLPSWKDPGTATELGISDLIPSMTATSWNWTLEELQAWVTGGRVDVDAVYQPSDGDSYYIVYPVVGAPLYLGLELTYGYSVGINWGDGSTETYTADSTGTCYLSHTYTDDAYYLISVSGEYAIASYFVNQSSIGYPRTELIYAFVGANVSDLNTYAFYCCYNLRGLYLPDSVSNTSTSATTRYMCYQCFALEIVVLPHDIANMGYNTFYYCTALHHFAAPGGMITTGTTPHAYTNLSHLSFPAGSSSIYARQCKGLLTLNLPGAASELKTVDVYYCDSLRSINGLNVTSSFSASYCYALTYLTNVSLISTDVDFSYSSYLTYESILNVFNALDEDNAGTVTLSSDSYALLSDDDLAIATDKGWTVTT